MIDRAAIFSDLLRRNAIRREAKLPLLDVRQTYEREVERRLWIEYARQNSARVQAEVLGKQRAKYGPAYPVSGGGRLAVGCLVHKALREGFRAQRLT